MNVILSCLVCVCKGCVGVYWHSPEQRDGRFFHPGISQRVWPGPLGNELHSTGEEASVLHEPIDGSGCERELEDGGGRQWRPQDHHCRGSNNFELL